MSLSDLAAIGSFVSGLAVLISLVYLAIQVRQTDKNQQASIRQNRAIHTASMNAQLIQPEAAEAIAKGLWGDEDITVTQLDQFIRYSRAMFIGAEDSFFQHTAGLLSDSAFATYVGGLRMGFSQPGYRAMWKRNRRYFPPEFVTFMDELEKETRVLSGNQRLERWNADVAAEKAKKIHD
jgi:hypothetical protein